MRLVTMFLLLIAAVSAHADNVWETHMEGNGTPFEKRWATADPLTDESSVGTMLGSAGISADDGELELYVIHPYPIGDALVSAFTGEELECEYDTWRLAVDRREFKIADTHDSTDNSGKFLQPQQMEEFWQAFIDGSVLAVQVERTCNGDMDFATLVYSLEGSQVAVEYVLNKVAVLEPDLDDDTHLQAIASDDKMRYMFALQQKVVRNWSRPASAQIGLDCVVRVRQTEYGKVTSTNVVSCNGDDAVVRSIEAAVRKSSPLPLPANSNLFEPELRFVFKPED